MAVVVGEASAALAPRRARRRSSKGELELNSFPVALPHRSVRWVPITKLGRLVKGRYIRSLESIYLFSLPVKEAQIVETFLPELADEVMKIMPIQKQTRAGQRTRFKAFVIVGDKNGHIGLGVKGKGCLSLSVACSNACRSCQGSCQRHPWCHHGRQDRCGARASRILG